MTEAPDSRPDARVISDSDLQRVIARAAELDRTDSEWLTLGDVRSVSEEVGLSTRAVDKAFSEVAIDATTRTALKAAMSASRSYTRKCLLASAAIYGAISVGIGGAFFSGVVDASNAVTLLAFFGTVIPPIVGIVAARTPRDRD